MRYLVHLLLCPHPAPTLRPARKTLVHKRGLHARVADARVVTYASDTQATAPSRDALGSVTSRAPVVLPFRASGQPCAAAWFRTRCLRVTAAVGRLGKPSYRRRHPPWNQACAALQHKPEALAREAFALTSA